MKPSTLVSRLIEARGKSQRKKILAANVALADVRLARMLKAECYRVWTSAPAEARRVADALTTLAEVSPSTETSAMHFWVEGIADITRGKLENAVENLDRASELLARIGNKHESAQPQVAKLIALAMLGKYEEANAAGRKALKIFERFDDQLAAGKIEMNLSNVVSRRDQYRLAEKYCLSAYERFARLGETEWQTMAENGLANTYAELNEFGRAEEFYTRALTRARKAKMNLTVAEIEASIGNLALFRGRYAEALRSLERSRQMYEKLGMPHQTAIAELEIADIYAEMNLNAEAIEIYQRLIPALRRLKMRGEEARARANLGQALMSAGDYRAARSELRKAVSLFAAERNPVAEAAVGLRQASLEARLENYPAALEKTDAVLRQIRSSENARLWQSARWMRGDILNALGQNDEAEGVLIDVIDDARRLEHPAILQSAMNSLGELSLKRRRLRRAERFFTGAIASIEDARAPLPGEEFRMAFLAKTLEPYTNLARLYLDEGKNEEAFITFERSRSRSLLEAVTGERSDELAATMKVREELNRYYTRLDRAEDDERPKLEKEIRRRERQLASTTLRAHSTARRKRSVGSSELDLGALQKKLGAEKALIEFVTDRDVISAFVVTGRSVDYLADIAHERGVMSMLEGLHFQFGSLRFGGAAVASFATQLKARADVYLASLYTTLIKPLEHLVGDRDIVIVPAGPLNYVPFHALFDGQKYLIESRDVTSSPSAAVWLNLNSRRPTPISNALVLGFADEKIPLVDREVKRLVRTLPETTGFTGRRATFAAFRSNAPNFDLIHLACHGQFRPDNPMFSSLHLADGWVTVRDVCSTRLNAQLITLSACETGLSSVYPGEEILGLARGFLSAGARSLVLSLWTVNDEATAELMGELYAGLQRGLGVSASLRVAQRKFIDRGEHPYFWSSFFAIA
jgi:tetratricopeptide (TPR) repeat protein